MCKQQYGKPVVEQILFKADIVTVHDIHVQETTACRVLVVLPEQAGGFVLRLFPDLMDVLLFIDFGFVARRKQQELCRSVIGKPKCIPDLILFFEQLFHLILVTPIEV